MPSDLFRKHAAAIRAVRAADLGCAVDDFDAHRLVIVPRPEPPREPFVALGVTFGTGTVLSIDDAYLDWAAANQPAVHYNVFKPPFFLEHLVAEAARRGRKLSTRGPNLGFTLAQEPGAVDIPPGLEPLIVDQAWRDEFRPRRIFENALGDPDDTHDTAWLFGIALYDTTGKPVACTGAWDDGPGIAEIGIDVARSARGQGVAPIAVQLIAAEIIARGMIPTYYCAPTNVRSHRTALASGFLPVTSTARATDRGPLEGSRGSLTSGAAGRSGRRGSPNRA